MMANMHNPLPEGKFCDEHKNAVKPSTVEDYSRNMDSMDKPEKMADSYSISQCTWTWTEKLSSTS
jgi:hypothetical protein